MLHVDIPTRSDLERLVTFRAPACVSIYLPTTPLTQDAQADRIALANLRDEAVGQLEAAAENREARMRVRAMVAQLDDLIDDDEFWAMQARSLAVFVTEDRIATFRLANRLEATVEVADRFHVKPLLRAVTKRHEAFVLALSIEAVRLVEVTADLPPAVVAVPDLPRDMSDAVGRGSLASRSPRGRIQGSEGYKVRIAQYARAVDQALRGFLAGREEPLILAATAPIDSIFRAHCTYPHLAAEGIGGNPDTTADHELASAARTVLDGLHAQEVRDFAELFEARTRADRTTTDLAHAAAAATHGAVAEIAVDIDTTVPGLVDDETGAVTLADTGSAATHGVVDQIAARVLLTGGRVLALRRDEIPGGGELAAVLRYPFNMDR
ncbi:MAG: hypothetical protein ACOC3D_07725 [Pseudomonadota bacterium]